MGDLARPSVPSGLAKRARMILLAADGTPNAETTRVTGLSRPTMIAWRWGSRPGRPVPGLRTGHLVRDRGQGVAEMGDPAPPAGEIQVQHRPGAGGETPRRRGPVPGPPANAAVVSVDEKSQIPALNRTAPILPLRLACPSGAPTTARTTAPRPCLPPSRSPPGRSPHAPATPGTATRSASASSRRSPPPIPGGPARRAGQLWHPQAPRGRHVARPAGEPGITLHYTPYRLLVAEHGERASSASSAARPPPRRLPPRQGPHRRHRPLHRRL